MTDDFAMKFPVHSLLLKDGSGVILLRHGPALWLPIFTDADALETYVERAEIRAYRRVDLATPENLARFLEDPPSRIKPAQFDAVIVDPIAPEPGTVSLFNPPDLIASLRKK